MVKHFDLGGGGGGAPYVNYFVKIGRGRYHKIMISTQH
jgi:hypothetical protein